jgi:hypothetical protein
MAVSGAYTVTGNTVKLTAATSAPTPVQCKSVTLGGNQYRVINASTTQGCFLSFAQDAATATSNCVIPTGDGTNSSRTLYILPSTDEVITFVPNAYFTAITAANTADLYISCGDGM